MPLKLFARAPRFCPTRIFAGWEDRSFYLLSSLFLLRFVCIARTGEPVGIRTGSTDLGPLLLFFSSRRAANGGSPPRAIAPGFIFFIPLPLPLPSLFLSLSFCLFSACPCSSFAFLSSPLLRSRSASYRGSLPCPFLCICTYVSCSSPITFTSFYRPPVIRNGYAPCCTGVSSAQSLRPRAKFYPADFAPDSAPNSRARSEIDVVFQCFP